MLQRSLCDEARDKERAAVYVSGVMFLGFREELLCTCMVPIPFPSVVDVAGSISQRRTFYPYE